MKRFLRLKKKKVKDDADISYRPPSVRQSNDTAAAHNVNDASLSTFDIADRSPPSRRPSLVPSPAPATPAVDDDDRDGAATTISDVESDATSGYRYALTAYAGTIDPAFSNEDGMGGGGGTLRSRSGRGSAGSRHRGLIPVFEDAPASSSATSSPSARVISPRISVSGDKGVTWTPISGDYAQDRNAAYEQLTRGGGADRIDGKGWNAIPEQPRSAELEGRGGQQSHDTTVLQVPSLNSNTSSQPSRSNNSQQSINTRTLMDEVMAQPESASVLDLSGQRNPSSQNNDGWPSREQSMEDQNNDMTSIQLDPTRSLSPRTTTSHPSPHLRDIESPSNGPLILQPDAIYEERYGDAYVDGLVKYLYPAGYQSMRPRSGPWKLSIFIFLLFLWLSVFIVGHCYDRGQREYGYYFADADDAYLQEVEDDMLVMETRWCGSKLLYFMWMVSVWVAVLSMSYCSIIGYVKVRDIAVANGRSQPPGMGAAGGDNGRSDFYVAVGCAGGADAGADGPGGDRGAGGHASYQEGNRRRRYAPSIYQSDGTPQFWGGHIYRPTQAAVAMTNRP